MYNSKGNANNMQQQQHNHSNDHHYISQLHHPWVGKHIIFKQAANKYRAPTDGAVLVADATYYYLLGTIDFWDSYKGLFTVRISDNSVKKMTEVEAENGLQFTKDTWLDLFWNYTWPILKDSYRWSVISKGSDLLFFLPPNKQLQQDNRLPSLTTPQQVFQYLEQYCPPAVLEHVLPEYITRLYYAPHIVSNNSGDDRNYSAAVVYRPQEEIAAKNEMAAAAAALLSVSQSQIHSHRVYKEKNMTYAAERGTQRGPAAINNHNQEPGFNQEILDPRKATENSAIRSTGPKKPSRGFDMSFILH